MSHFLKTKEKNLNGVLKDLPRLLSKVDDLNIVKNVSNKLQMIQYWFK